MMLLLSEAAVGIVEPIPMEGIAPAHGKVMVRDIKGSRVMRSVIMSKCSRYTDIVVIISINIAYDVAMRMMRSSSCVIRIKTIMYRSSSISNMNIIIVIRCCRIIIIVDVIVVDIFMTDINIDMRKTGKN